MIKCKNCNKPMGRHHWKNGWCPHPDKDANLSNLAPAWLKTTFELAEPAQPSPSVPRCPRCKNIDINLRHDADGVHVWCSTCGSSWPTQSMLLADFAQFFAPQLEPEHIFTNNRIWCHIHGEITELCVCFDKWRKSEPILPVSPHMPLSGVIPGTHKRKESDDGKTDSSAGLAATGESVVPVSRRNQESPEPERWVSVKERLPKFTQRIEQQELSFTDDVLAFNAEDGGKIVIANLNQFDEQELAWVDSEGSTLEAVTHWQPLPAPPAEGTGED
jgi:Protein of unknown function (DUF551)